MRTLLCFVNLRALLQNDGSKIYMGESFNLPALLCFDEGDCYKRAVRLLVGLTMRSYWFARDALPAHMIARFALICLFLLALTAGLRFNGFLGLLDRVVMWAAHESDCYERAVCLLVGLTMRSYWFGSTCFACAELFLLACSDLPFFDDSDSLTLL